MGDMNCPIWTSCVVKKTGLYWDHSVDFYQQFIEQPSIIQKVEL